MKKKQSNAPAESRREETAQVERPFFVPKLGVTVNAPTLADAVAKVTKKRKQEDGDGR